MAGPTPSGRRSARRVKFGRIAEGSADIYPRFGPTCEWDVGAGYAVVTAAGGKVTDGKGGAAPIRRAARWRLHHPGVHRLG